MPYLKVWYGDIPNRRCNDCGEKTDWDERLRLGHYPKGGPTHSDGVTPLYDPNRRYGNTPEGLAEQAKLETHHDKYHKGGRIAIEIHNGWTLEINKYATGTAAAREFLKQKRPYYGILSIKAPNGTVVYDILEGGKTPGEIRQRASFTVASQKGE